MTPSFCCWDILTVSVLQSERLHRQQEGGRRSEVTAHGQQGLGGTPKQENGHRGDGKCQIKAGRVLFHKRLNVKWEILYAFILKKHKKQVKDEIKKTDFNVISDRNHPTATV